MADIANAADRGGRWLCDRLGFESAGEGKVIRYRAISPEGAAIDCRIDSRLGFAVSVHRADGAVMELRNIQEWPLPASLFEIPPNFHRFDPHQLIDRIKQSNVWVEPPR